MGGILDIGVRSPKREGISGLLQVDVVDARAVFEERIDDRRRFAIAGHRSWVDARRGRVLRSVGTGVSKALVYVDKKWTFTRWKHRGHLDIQSVLNRTNAARIDFIHNDSQTGILGGVPLLPVLDVRAEL